MDSNQIIIYQTDDGQTQIDVRMENDTVWLNTNQMASLFDREESNIRRHVINVFREGELLKDNNVHFLHVNGVPLYNLKSIRHTVEGQEGAGSRSLLFCFRPTKKNPHSPFAASGKSSTFAGKIWTTTTTTCRVVVAYRIAKTKNPV